MPTYSSYSALGYDVQTAEIDDDAVTDAKLSAAVGTRIEIRVPFNPSVGQGTWVLSRNENYTGDWYYRNSTEADGDNITFKVALQRGTYTLRIYVAKNSGACILDVDLGGTEIASEDLYTGAGTDYDYIMEQTSITVSASGVKDLKLRADGKNGASANYGINFVKIELIRTA